MKLGLAEFSNKSGVLHWVNFFFSKTFRDDLQLSKDVEALLNSNLFDAAWYKSMYPDVLGTSSDAARHYIKHGANEGRNPHPVFDTNYYVRANHDVITSGLNPLMHYIKYGEKERRDPHPLFDTKFYLSNNPDVLRNGIGALRHYLGYGGKEGRDPNQYFESKWYLDHHPDVAVAHLNPLVHYITFGESHGYNPSSRFDVDWYLRCNLDVAKARVSPLYHFLQSGSAEGREPCRAYGLLGAVTDSDIRCVKAPSFDNEIALFITHSPTGRLKPHVRYYLDSLNQYGISTILIVAADAPFLDADADLIPHMNGILIRQNVGFDFAAWAHVLYLYPEILNSNILYLINDSVIGPLDDNAFRVIIEKIRMSSADFVGLTDSYESCWHIQSYFLALKKSALVTDALRGFFDSVVSFSNKNSVIAEYETRLASILMDAGLTSEVVFPQVGSEPINRTLFHWKALTEAGFPFIKVSTIRDGHPEADTTGWRDTLSSYHFDISLVNGLLLEPHTSVDANDIVAPARKRRPYLPVNDKSDDVQTEFDSAFYLAIYPDIAAAGVNPHDHYVKHGRAEGRLAREPRELDVLDDFGASSPSETILIVSHEGVRGGAPVLAYNLVKGLIRKYNVIILFLSSGPMLQSCRDLGAIVVGPIGLAGSKELADLVVKRIIRASPIKFAVVNTVESRYILPALAKHYIPALSLIHEFAAYIRPRGAFREAALWSGEVVFSTRITRDNALSHYPELSGKDYPIIPQGRCILPKEDVINAPKERDERTYVRRLLRPSIFPAQGLVVVGAGLVEYRKGVDLFIDCAARVLKSDLDLPVRFAWIGRGYNPDGDVGYSAYLADQIQRSGIDEHFCFVNEVSDLAAVYECADMLLVSSRLDPLPNVAIDALATGLPVVCFSDTTGIADILIKQGLEKQTVADYLDTAGMAEKVVALVRSKSLRLHVANECRLIAENTFTMATYLSRLEEAAEREMVRAKQEKLDVELISQSDLLRLDFYLLPAHLGRPRSDVVREYVRSWASGVGRRKIFPGFHPGIYEEERGIKEQYGDPLADYLRAGKPSGPWAVPVIEPNDRWEPIPSSVRIALHIHAYHLHVFPDIIERLTQNTVRPDLLISVKSEPARRKVGEQLESYSGGTVDVRLVPDPGRDVGPFLTEFGQTMLDHYDIIGHVHTKTSGDLADSSVGKTWVRFLMDNVLGSREAPMADIILSRMVNDSRLGLVFPDDPHVIGWDKNKEFVCPYVSEFSLKTYPENLWFPVGAFFWARPEALKPMFNLGLGWDDYPVEPLPYDGSLLHGLERLYGLATRSAGFEIANTYISGVTR